MTSNFNTAPAGQVLFSNTTGVDNTAFGLNALYPTGSAATTPPPE